LIDIESFSPALRAGAVDACLDYLRREEGGGPTDAPLNCRAAEALFHCGRRDEALECGRRAFALTTEDHDTAQFCGIMAQIPVTVNDHHRAGACQCKGEGAELIVRPTTNRRLTKPTQQSTPFDNGNRNLPAYPGVIAPVDYGFD